MLNIETLRTKYQSGTTPKEELDRLYKTIDQDSQRKDKLNTYNCLTKELAYSQVEKPIKGPLEGIFVAVKDNIHIKGLKTTCSSKILSNYEAIYTATVVENLKKAGAVIVGKANMDEFAMGATNTMSYFGDVRNPHNREHVAGGSSGGSAASVAAGFASLALGTDTGGSVRVPSAYCGVVGLKPTYGAISRYGVMSMAPILDQVGPIASNVADCALLYSVLATYDVNDPNSVEMPAIDFEALKTPKKKYTIGVIKELESELVHKSVVEKFHNTLELLKQEGYKIVEISFPEITHAIETYFIISRVQGFSALSMIDGIRYGNRVESTNLMEVYKQSRGEGFHPEVIKRLMVGNYILSHNDFYPKARKVQTLLFNKLKHLFSEGIDCILSPATLSSAPRLDALGQSNVESFLVDMIASVANLTGIPAISVPIGKDECKMPVGLQIMGDLQQEQTLFEVAQIVESFGQQ